MTESPTAAAALAPVDAVVFDLDGVVTDTAEFHAAAWKELFDAVLQDSRIPQDARRDPFTDADYLSYVDGRTREDGVTAFLESRGVTLPAGGPRMARGNGPWRGLAHARTASSKNCWASARPCFP